MTTYDISKLNTRTQKILESLGREGMVRVVTLSQTLGASEVTIRNDLAELERGGFLERIPGGALQTLKNYYNMDFQQRKQQNSEEKQAIATKAADLVFDGETLLINSGTTTFFTSLELKKCKNIKIVTNSLTIATELGGIPTIRVLLLGGQLNAQYSFTYGDDAIAQLKKYKADKLILSVDGIDADKGLTTYHAEETELIRLMIERARSTIVVADYSKVGHESFSYLGPIEDADYLVTNRNGNSDQLRKIAERKVEVIKI